MKPVLLTLVTLVSLMFGLCQPKFLIISTDQEGNARAGAGGDGRAGDAGETGLDGPGTDYSEDYSYEFGNYSDYEDYFQQYCAGRIGYTMSRAPIHAGKHTNKHMLF